MLRLLKTNTSLLLLSFAVVCEASAQQASARLNLGTLRCTIASGVAVIVDSPRNLRCMFYKSDGSQEAYRGEVRGGGLNVGITGRTFAAWAVTGDAGPMSATSLSGRYSGVEAGVTVGVGVTSRSLTNLSKSVSLQPLDVGPQSGLNIALGIAQIDLFALGAPQLPTTAGPLPLVPERSYPAPAPQPELTPTPPRTPDYVCAEEARLQPSQTLSGLARACRISVAALLEANPQITNVRTIQTGTLIRIPQQPYSSTGRCGTRTLAKSGETLADVASRCSVSINEMLLANPDLSSDRTIPGGQVLAVPPVGKTTERIELADKTPLEEAKKPESTTETPNAGEPERTTGGPPSEAEEAVLAESPAQEALETEQQQQQEAYSEFAQVEDRCRQVASKQYGLLVDQISTATTSETDENRYAVVLNVGTMEVICLFDQQSELLSLTEVRKPAEQASIEPNTYEVIRSRLPDDETLITVDMSNQTEIRQVGRIEGYRSTAYGFRARANEMLEIMLEADNDNVNFNVVSAEMPYGQALFVGKAGTRNRTFLSFPRGGIYLVRPYLTAQAARQNETATYTLRISRARPLPAVPPGKADRENFAPSGKSDPLVPLN